MSENLVSKHPGSKRRYHRPKRRPARSTPVRQARPLDQFERYVHYVEQNNNSTNLTPRQLRRWTKKLRAERAREHNETAGALWRKP